MAFQSIFLSGECTVTIDRGGGDPFWQGVIGLGESSPDFNGLFGTDEPMRVDVDSSGLISLVWRGATGADFYRITVTPTVSLENAVVLSDEMAGYVFLSNDDGAYCVVSGQSNVNLSFDWPGSAGVVAYDPNSFQFASGEITFVQMSQGGAA